MRWVLFVMLLLTAGLTLYRGHVVETVILVGLALLAKPKAVSTVTFKQSYPHELRKPTRKVAVTEPIDSADPEHMPQMPEGDIKF